MGDVPSDDVAQSVSSSGWPARQQQRWPSPSGAVARTGKPPVDRRPARTALVVRRPGRLGRAAEHGLAGGPWWPRRGRRSPPRSLTPPPSSTAGSTDVESQTSRQRLQRSGNDPGDRVPSERPPLQVRATTRRLCRRHSSKLTQRRRTRTQTPRQAPDVTRPDRPDPDRHVSRETSPGPWHAHGRGSTMGEVRSIQGRLGRFCRRGIGARRRDTIHVTIHRPLSDELPSDWVDPLRRAACRAAAW